MLGLGDKMKGGMKEQAMSMLGEEEFELVADLVNEQLNQQAQMLELAGVDYEVDEIPAEKIEMAMDKHGIDKAFQAILGSFNKEQTKIQKEILRQMDVETDKIEEFPQ